MKRIRMVAGERRKGIADYVLVAVLVALVCLGAVTFTGHGQGDMFDRSGAGAPAPSSTPSSTTGR